MDRLEVGELVLVPASGNSLKFERVEMFYHRKPDENTLFFQLETESGKQLSLTPLHLLPFGNCSEMEYGELDSDKIERWLQKSSPMTVEGALLTNGILSSCFSQIESHVLQKAIFKIFVIMRIRHF
uniref:Hedgehog protein Hint domain-containing protein n=1 Tax=Meloidogyne incognita TaxID=6306 RepID=A0A914M8Y9_MELIC